MASERRRHVVTSGDATICAESIGDPAAPAVLLIAGAASSMDWWEDGLCDLIASAGRRVVRYDHRDTGESTTYPAGSPGYSRSELVADAVAVLDDLAIDAAGVAGLSMGGGIAQVLALEHRDRVRSLALASTTLVIGEGLPGMTPEVAAAFSGETPEPDWGDRDATVEWMVEAERPFAGAGGYDEGRMRALARRVYDRSADLEATYTNHFMLTDDPPAGRSLAELAGIPTVVIHGTDDGLFPRHGEALAAAIPGAELVELDGVGHEFPPERTWKTFSAAIVSLGED